MLSLPPSVRVFVATQSVDGRKGADSLAAMVRSVLNHDVLGGHLYVFFTRHRNRVRVLYWDRDGFALWSKRLEKGRYRPPLASAEGESVRALECAELALILEGIELAGAKRRGRWVPTRRPPERAPFDRRRGPHRPSPHDGATPGA